LLYNQWITTIFNATDEVQGEKSKDSLRQKCVQYLERAEKLKKYLETGKDKKPMKEGTSSSGKYVARTLKLNSVHHVLSLVQV
jgi:hypothetical protein